MSAILEEYTLHHIDYSVVPGQIETADLIMREMLGLDEYMDFRKIEPWGEMRFYFHPEYFRLMAVALQLICVNSNSEQSTTHDEEIFDHFALQIDNPGSYVTKIQEWALNHQIVCVIDVMSGDKIWVQFPDVLKFAIELVPMEQL